MAGKHSKSGRKRTHKNRRQRGGGWGFTGASSIPGTPGIVSNPYVATAIGDCRAVQPGYNIPTSQYGASMKGLPGMSGGKHKRTRKMKGRKRTQRGGRYGFAPEMDPNANGQAWWAGSYAPIQRIACEGTTQNPLNPTHTGSSAPPGAAPPNYYFNAMKGLMSGGSNAKKSKATSSQRGGAQQMAPATYGVGNVDSMYYYAPTAGYANNASTWVDSVGAPVQIQVPFAARSMNQACLSTGGHLPLTGALQKGGGRRRNRTIKGGGFLNGIKRALGYAAPAAAVAPTFPNERTSIVNPAADAADTAPTFPNEGSSMINLTKPGTGLTNAQRNAAKKAANNAAKTIFPGLMAPETATSALPPPPNTVSGEGRQSQVIVGGRRHKKSKSRKVKHHKH